MAEKEHPTPWKVIRTKNINLWIADANGESVLPLGAFRCMNEARAMRIATRIVLAVNGAAYAALTEERGPDNARSKVIS